MSTSRDMHGALPVALCVWFCMWLYGDGGKKVESCPSCIALTLHLDLDPPKLSPSHPKHIKDSLKWFHFRNIPLKYFMVPELVLSACDYCVHHFQMREGSWMPPLTRLVVYLTS